MHPQNPENQPGTQGQPHTQEPTSSGGSATGNWLQVAREGMAAVISLVILVLTAITLYGTYDFAKHIPSTADAAAAKEAYERQKDIMLYALALLGTVTGYYLGRVPAELHAQSAEKAANQAQQQLQTTQTKLTDTAGNAAAAATQLGIAQNDKTKAQARAAVAVDALEHVQKAMETPPAAGPRGVLGGGEEDEAARAERSRKLQEAKDEVDRVLSRLRNPVG